MTRLRRSDLNVPGITRKRHGKGFSYWDDDGNKIEEPEVLARINELVIPPAWKDVWVCPWPMGHVQATGIDAAGRKQYLYHPKWREDRDRQKFDDMVAFAQDLPKLREDAQAALEGTTSLTRDRVLACAVRLLDHGFFRIGSEDYAVTNETYGLATMRKEHVTVEADGAMTFDYIAKSGKHRVQGVSDPLSAEVVAKLRRRRGGGEELLAYKAKGEWRDVRSADINAWIKEHTGGDHSAKDFRTWSATLLAAQALAVSGEVAGTVTGRKRAVVRAVKEVAHYLGNTPAVCRASYIDPRVIDAYDGGVVIDLSTLFDADDEPGERLTIHRRAVEQAVLRLLDGHEAGTGLERLDVAA